MIARKFSVVLDIWRAPARLLFAVAYLGFLPAIFMRALECYAYLLIMLLVKASRALPQWALSAKREIAYKSVYSRLEIDWCRACTDYVGTAAIVLIPRVSNLRPEENYCKSDSL